VNRTDRLYALVEELRAAAPRARTAEWLAEHFEVTTRTVQRDLSALQQTGVPIWSTPGPGGGYTIDPALTLPPVTFTPSEATAMAVALAASGTIPFAADAASALRKVMGAMTDSGRDHARQLAKRIRFLQQTGELAGGPVLRAVERAMTEDRVLSIDYRDKTGVRTSNRLIEPHSLAGSDRSWYLLAWCQLRGGGRTFRLDRISAARVTQQPVTPRRYDELVKPAANMPPFRPVSLDE
jgi:predicted DNA-binding transcriptional regulator YafY